MRRIWLVAFSLVSSAPSWACSPDGEYQPPTNIELIERADLVVLGRISARGATDAAHGTELNLEPIRSMKGSVPDRLTLYGVVRDRQGKPIPPEPTKLDRVHSSSAWGSCDRQAYAPGTLVIAMFKKRPEGYMRLIYPFARNVEDVEGPHALWVRATALYAKIISETRPSERRKAFQNARERLLARTGDPDAQAIAEDITSYLQTTATR